MSAEQRPDLYSRDGLEAVSRVNRPATTEPRVDKSALKRHSQSSSLRPHEHAIADEDFFLQTLALERKRSERSGKPFLLVILRSSEIFEGKAGTKVVRQFQRKACSLIRDIDIVGWYEDEAALGIIFTEIAEASAVVATAILRRITEAMSRTLEAEQLAKIAMTCHMFPDDSGTDGSDGNERMRFYPDVPRSQRHRRSAHLMKRALDVVGSLLALALLSPLFLVMAILIKITSPGPVWFRQRRVGQCGNPFTLWKFRSMYENNDSAIHRDYVRKFIAGKHPSQASAKVFKITNDPRITTIGAFLRRTSLDELPQFFNVLKGEMSLVGPRPPLPYELEQYDMWHRRRVLEVKPGITGLWQVSGRSKVNFDEMVRLDLKYARKWSIAMDLKILWLTPKAVMSGEGAY